MNRIIKPIIKGLSLVILFLFLTGIKIDNVFAANCPGGIPCVDSNDIINGQVQTRDIKKNAVRGKHIKKNSVTGIKVKDGSLTGADIDPTTTLNVGSAGIGTENPSGKLDVADAVNPTLVGGNGNCPVGYIHKDINGNGVEDNGECWRGMTVDNQGNVGIGTLSPTRELDVEGTVKATDFEGDGSGLTNIPAGPLGTTIESGEITDGTIVDGDIDNSAAIAGTKINPDFGAQNVTTTGTITGATFTGGGLDADDVTLADVKAAASNDFHNIGGVDATNDTVQGGELDGVFSTIGLLKRTAPNTYTTIIDKSLNWNTAYGWGNHAAAGYLTGETDPQVGSNTINRVPKWNGGSLVTGLIYDNGARIGIGTTGPRVKLEVNGGFRLASDAASCANSSINCYGNIQHAGSGGLIINSRTGGSWADMHLQTNGTTRMFIESAGNVGIGTTGPRVKLEVNGGFRLASDAASCANSSINCYGNIQHAGSGGLIINSRTGGSWADMHLQTNGITRMFIESAGNVGIGTTNPRGKLDVNGRIYQRGGLLHADYVFEPEYKLESIEEHAEYMWNKKHLKAVPKATTDKDGMEVVEVGSHRRGIVEELEKAHIYIEQMHNTIKGLEERLVKLESSK